MAVSGVDKEAAGRARQEAADWIARMGRPDAGMSRLDFERWRARDPRNRAAYAEMQGIAQLSRRLGETPTGREYLERRRRHSFFALPGMRVAMASLIMLIVAGGAVSLVLRDRGGSLEIARAGKPLVTRLGEIHRLRLGDGTVVTLDTDSAIIPIFTDVVRTVRLTRGRARFDVAHETQRPFMVEVGNKTVVARGTLFDVVLNRNGVSVTLLRGAVDIRRRVASGKGAPVARLVPGQVFVDTSNLGPAKISPAPPGRDRWISGMLSYDGAPLGEVVVEANRYSARKIRLGDPGLAALRVTGVFHASPTEDLAGMLAATFHLQVEQTERGDLVLHRR
jgi:transmembrane sensor